MARCAGTTRRDGGSLHSPKRLSHSRRQCRAGEVAGMGSHGGLRAMGRQLRRRLQDSSTRARRGCQGQSAQAHHRHVRRATARRCGRQSRDARLDRAIETRTREAAISHAELSERHRASAAGKTRRTGRASRSHLNPAAPGTAPDGRAAGSNHGGQLKRECAERPRLSGVAREQRIFPGAIQRVGFRGGCERQRHGQRHHFAGTFWTLPIRRSEPAEPRCLHAT